MTITVSFDLARTTDVKLNPQDSVLKPVVDFAHGWSPSDVSETTGVQY